MSLAVPLHEGTVGVAVAGARAGAAQPVGGHGGGVVADEADNRRATVTAALAQVQPLKDNTSGGLVRGPCRVFRRVVTATITLPLGVALYCPEPARTAGARRDRGLKRQGVPTRRRPPPPPCPPAYPSPADLALQHLTPFQQSHPTVNVKGVLAEALAGPAPLMDTAAALLGGSPVISHRRHNQQGRCRHRTLSVSQYVERDPGVPPPRRSRGGETLTASGGSARLYLCARGKQRVVIALHYAGETDYRSPVAAELRWRTQDIVQVVPLRGLIEVFFQDWKAHEGWGTVTPQRGAEGSSRSLILSLRVDHGRRLQPDPLAPLKQQQPAYIVGSLITR
jgi:hypothetical protein